MAHQAGNARVTIRTDEATGIVVGCYAIAQTNVAPDGVSGKARAGQSGTGQGDLIAMLALMSRHLTGKWLGGESLLDEPIPKVVQLAAVNATAGCCRAVRAHRGC